MSKGLGEIEQRILRYFIERDGCKMATVRTLCASVYPNRCWVLRDGKGTVDPDWYPDRVQEVAVRRALQSLQRKGYPVAFIRIPMKRQGGRPLIAVWQGNNRHWRVRLREGDL
jgi:hypothetical protein